MKILIILFIIYSGILLFNIYDTLQNILALLHIVISGDEPDE